MGNSQAKESRPGSSRGHQQPSGSRNPSTASAAGPSGRSGSHQDASHGGPYAAPSGRGSRPDLSFLGLSLGSDRDPAQEPRRETKAEREVRKQEKERVLRTQERERSIRDESVDGGFLVTLGTYTGPEDFSKPVVRQLQIERRLAPFWKGLNDHSDTWTENQLVAVVNDLPLPAPDEIPPEEPPHAASSNTLSTEWSPRGSSNNVNSLTVPMNPRSLSQNSDRSANLSPSHPAFSLPSSASPISAPSSSSPFFRGRAKTLAALTTGSRNNSQTEMTPHEIQLPKDPYINGQRIEVFLYKDASECPICFLYYPPYLNKTRCCDQPICSECFVQIKRPDPHPPEHHDTSSPPTLDSQGEIQLVSEPAACPFCVQPEFGVTYDPPPFRRGLTYANQNHVANAASAMSSSSSLASQGITSPGRRRAHSLAANDRSVITTDRVRPDWAKKLADARANAMRRAAAATALHNAAYMMGNIEASGSRGFSLGRRRRTMFGNDSAGSSGNGTPRRDADGVSYPGATGPSRNEGANDLLGARNSSRRGNRLEDLEELMMMEAIRLSLAAEEERKKKEEKEAAKEAKKEEKKKSKEAKKVEKQSRKGAVFPTSNSITNLVGEGEFQAGSSSSANGKGKAVDRSGGSAGFNPLTEPTSTVNNSSSRDDPQRHLEHSRAELQRERSGTGSGLSLYDDHPAYRASNLSTASSSSASSFADSPPGSLRGGSQGGFGASSSTFGQSPNASGVSLDHEETPTPEQEPMFNFSSLEAVISGDQKDDPEKVQYTENVQGAQGSSQHGTPEISVQSPGYIATAAEPADTMEESVTTIRPTAHSNEEDRIDSVPPVEVVSNGGSPASLDTKHIDVNMVNSREQATQ